MEWPSSNDIKHAWNSKAQGLYPNPETGYFFCVVSGGPIHTYFQEQREWLMRKTISAYHSFYR